MSARGGSPSRRDKDAIFLSPHKFIGGPGTPGVLVVRRSCSPTGCRPCPAAAPSLYVNPVEHRYLDDPVHREEGGTPAIVESIRAGLVFQLKQAVGVADHPGPRGATCCARAVAAWEAKPTIEILGNLEARRLSIVSFVVLGPTGKYLHHNFVVALLNDLFGIQTRGGCSCAGPYGHRLLGIDLERSHQFEREIAIGCEGIKPGLGAGQLQLLHLRGRVRLPRRGRADRRAGRLAAAAATTASTRPPACGTTGAARSSRRCGSPTSATRRTAR